MPALAEYWTISDGGSRITFKLRPGVRFHNGRELTAEDVKYSLERLVKNRPGNTYYQYFTRKVVGAEEYWQGQADEVTGFRVVDPTTFEILWTRPFGSVGLYLLGMYYCKILPKDLLESQGRNFFQKPIGTGPFKFAEWIRSPRLDILGVALERNPFYFGKKPYLSAIEYSPHFTDDQFDEGSVHLVTVTSERILRKRYPGPGKQYPEDLLPGPELRYRSPRPGRGPQGPGPGARQAPPGRSLRYAPVPSPGPGQLHSAPAARASSRRAASPFTDPASAKLLLDRLLPESGRKAWR